RHRIDVGGQNGALPQFGCADRQQAGAGPQIQHIAERAFPRQVAQHFQAQRGGLVMAGAEGQPGTGHHETTTLCLEVLSDLARERAFCNVLDLGTGTGLLAIGAAKLWKRTVLASDIDPVAVEVARDNARANNVGPLVAAVVADGLANPILSRAAPYDLLIANILAGPLTQLAPGIIRSLAPGAVLVLSGLLNNQEKLVTSFYRSLRFVSARRGGPWSALVLEKAR